MSEEDVFELELSYIDTPKGKVPTHKTTRRLAEAMVMIQEETSKLGEKLKKVEEEGLSSGEIEEMRKHLGKIDTAISDILAQLDALTDSVQELIEVVKKDRESLPQTQQQLAEE